MERGPVESPCAQPRARAVVIDEAHRVLKWLVFYEKHAVTLAIVRQLYWLVVNCSCPIGLMF